MKIAIENRQKLPKILTFSFMRVIISLYIQLIFLFVDGAVSSAIYYKNFLDGSSVRVIISPYVLLIFLFVDGTVSSAIYYITLFCKVFSNATFTRSGKVSYSIQPTGFTH